MLRLALAIDQQVVHRAAVGIEHHPVEDLPRGHRADVVGEDMVDEGFGIRAAHEHLAHVRDVEDAGGLTDGVVLVDDAAVLDRHVITGKRAHLGMELDVEIMQTSHFQEIIHKVS